MKSVKRIKVVDSSSVLFSFLELNLEKKIVVRSFAIKSFVKASKSLVKHAKFAMAKLRKGDEVFFLDMLKRQLPKKKITLKSYRKCKDDLQKACTDLMGCKYNEFWRTRNLLQENSRIAYWKMQSKQKIPPWGSRLIQGASSCQDLFRRTQALALAVSNWSAVLEKIQVPKLWRIKTIDLYGLMDVDTLLATN